MQNHKYITDFTDFTLKSFINLLINLLIVSLIINLFVVSNSLAGIEKLIKNMTPKGTMSNVSRSALIDDQLSGHLVGGSVMIRTPPPDDMQLINFEAPSCKLGGLPCGLQLDLRGGALSFIKASQMGRFMKQLAQNVGTYALIMYIKTKCPQCEDIMTWLESVQRDVNQFNANSCDMAQVIAKGAFSAMSRGAEGLRQSDMAMKKKGSDMAEIRQKARKDDYDPTENNKELESQLGDNFNLVWKALEKKTANKEDATGFKELMMSISGTIIGKKNKDGKRQIIHKKSLVTEELIEEYISTAKKTKEIELYKCDESKKCLNPTKKKQKLDDSLYQQVKKLLGSITKKVDQNKGTLTEEEENIIAMSSLPLINKIQLDLAIYADSRDITVRMKEFVEVLCYDVTTNHLTKLLHKVAEAVAELGSLQTAEMQLLRDFETEVNQVLTYLHISKSNAFKRYNIISQTRGRMMQEENYFEQRFEDLLQHNSR